MTYKENHRYESGRLLVKKTVQEHYAAITPNFKVNDYKDFRVMLEKEKAIDAVLCATPDHLHAYVCLAAMRQGKHVYCEKPLTHNVAEARLVARVARETGVATQLGNQGHSGNDIRTTCEIIWSGAIGDVREVHAWTSGLTLEQATHQRHATHRRGAEGNELGLVARPARQPALQQCL